MSEVRHKRRVKQNVWGNLYGYEGTRKVKEFDLRTTEQEIQDWIDGKEPEPNPDVENLTHQLKPYEVQQ